MAEIMCSSQNCRVHMQVISEIEQIKEDIKELKEALKDTVDTSRLDELYKQVNDMRARIDKLTESDIRQSEALAGIHNVLAEFKEIHKSMRDDYNRLVESQIETQKNVAEMTGIMKGSVNQSKGSSGPWYVSLIKDNNWIQVAVFILVIFLICTVAFNWDDIMSLMHKWLGGAN